MTPPTTDTSREAVEALAAVLIDRKSCNTKFDQERAANKLIALLAERDALHDQLAAVNNEARKKELSKIMAEGGFDIANPSVAKAAFEMWELDGKPPLPSSDQLAAARNEALDKAKAAIRSECLAPDGTYSPEEADIMTAEASTVAVAIDAIDAIKSTTPAPREVTVQEAARVYPLDFSNALKHAFLSGFVAAKDLPAHEPYNGADCWVDYDPTSNPAYKRIAQALAKEEQSDE